MNSPARLTLLLNRMIKPPYVHHISRVDLTGTSFIDDGENPTPIELVKTSDFDAHQASLDDYQKASLKRQSFTAAKAKSPG